MDEEWRPVVGYEGYYEVSDLGRVRSLSRKYNRPSGEVKMTGRILKHGVALPRPGYPLVSLWRGNIGESNFVHSLVMAAFHDRIFGDGPISNHKNGHKTDNRPENLERCTYSENNQHAYDFGLKKRGGHKK